MGEVELRDERLLQQLIDQHLITISQLARVRAAIKRGASLHEAIAKTPLVDPLKLASVESLVASQSSGSREVKKLTLPPPAAPPPVAPPPPPPVALDDDFELDFDQPSTVKLGSESFELRDLGPVGSQVDHDEEASQSIGSVSTVRFQPKIPASPAPLPPDLDEDLMLPGDESHAAPSVQAGGDRPEMLSDELDLPEEFKPKAAPAPAPPAAPAAPKPPAPRRPKIPELPASMKDMDVDFEIPQSLSKAAGSVKPGPPAQLSTGFDAEVSRALDHAMDAPGQETPGAPNDEFAVLHQLHERDTYRSPAKSMQVYNTSDDEGINLIREVNEIFGAVLDEGGRGFLIDARRTDRNLIIYNESSALAHYQTIAPERIDKVINRLKVMARLEPWRRQNAQKGHFRIIHKGMNHNAYIRTDPRTAEKEVIVIHLENG